ncbi:hypothetical protein ACF0H5_015153 [Mactra antiquata]
MARNHCGSRRLVKGRQESLMAAEELPLPPPKETVTVSLQHSYTLESESPNLERMFDKMRIELQETKQQQADSVRCEKHAKQSLEFLFTELKEEC